nr:MAG TPA_asm: hypothetical protein [Caudoviricetes sp.]
MRPYVCLIGLRHIIARPYVCFKPQPLISRLLGGEKYLHLYLLYYADVQSRRQSLVLACKFCTQKATDKLLIKVY